MKDLTHLLGVQHPEINVTAKATYHRNVIEVWKPKHRYTKVEAGWESRSPLVLGTLRGQSTMREENIERSIRRTKREVKSLAINNTFQLWVTLTMASDRHDDHATYTKLESWLKAERRRTGKFDYLIVPEKHKDGAIHFHGLFGNYQGDLTPVINPKNNRPLLQKGRQVYNFKSYPHGYTVVEQIEDSERIATYITKYITKDMYATGLNKKRYWASRGLKRPRVEYNPEWLEKASGMEISRYEHEQGQLLFFDPQSVTDLIQP